MIVRKNALQEAGYRDGVWPLALMGHVQGQPPQNPTKEVRTMRILANYMLKQGKENYGSEQFMVSLEAESEFNNVGEITDYLFNQAKAAVQRQITGTASNGNPATTVPTPETTAQTAVPEKPVAPKEEPKAQAAAQKPADGNVGNTNGNGNGFVATEKQRGMIRKLMKENFKGRDDATKWLKEMGYEDTKSLTRKQASRVIESLMDRKRSA